MCRLQEEKTAFMLPRPTYILIFYFMTKTVFEILIRANEQAYKVLIALRQNLKESKLPRIPERLKNIDARIKFNRKHKNYIIHLYGNEKARANRKLNSSPQRAKEDSNQNWSTHRKDLQHREPKASWQNKCWYKSSRLQSSKWRA